MGAIIKNGMQLSEQEIKDINKLWAREGFGRVDKEESGDAVFFLVKKSEESVSVGKLQEQEVKFNSKKYKVVGISDVVSKYKGKGYGRELMECMRKYIVKNKLDAVSFCSEKNIGFYKKMGFQVSKKLMRRFRCKRENKDDDAVIYAKGSKLVSDMLAHKGKAEISWWW